MPDTIGFYNPITLSVAVPDGPPEFKAGWHQGCRTALGLKTFANAWVFQGKTGPDFGSGIYQHDPVYQGAWGSGYFACNLHTSQFVNWPSMQFGPLQ